MPRNLDLTALRSFIAVADTGGVTKAASVLNLTQSAVSMQLKRLEESLGQTLLDRSGRSIGLTTSGEQLLSYGRKMMRLNDEVFNRMTDHVFQGSMVLGVPHDIVYPAIPKVLQMFHAEYPRMRLQLLSASTFRLQEMFEEGRCDMILTTEEGCGPGGETLTRKNLLWYGAPGGTAWQRRPVPLASEPICSFRPIMMGALDKAGVPWDVVVDSDSSRTVEATVSADLAILAQLEGTAAGDLQPIQHGGALPELGSNCINLYLNETKSSEVLEALANLVRRSYKVTSLALTA
jgi:DNA-binding transcriptional LysR family regulator